MQNLTKIQTAHSHQTASRVKRYAKEAFYFAQNVD